jgi:hypothetical protein
MSARKPLPKFGWTKSTTIGAKFVQEVEAERDHILKDPESMEWLLVERTPEDREIINQYPASRDNTVYRKSGDWTKKWESRRPEKGAWVERAMLELQRTGARSAIPGKRFQSPIYRNSHLVVE